MVPAGAVITGRIFSQNLVSLSRRRFLSTERSGGGCSARDKKKVMATKKNEYRKMTGKEQGGGRISRWDKVEKQHATERGRRTNRAGKQVK